MRLTALVPATSANLGPGFDCFGLALDLCNEVTIETNGEPGVSWEGEGADELATDGTDLVSRAIEAAVRTQARFHPAASVPPFALHGLNRIPLERGLGSSSAATVAGTALAAALLGSAGWDDPYTTFAYAAELEGHPDNAAPASYGGLTVVADGFVHRFDVPEAISPIVLIPTEPSPDPRGETGAARPGRQARRGLQRRARRADDSRARHRGSRPPAGRPARPPAPGGPPDPPARDPERCSRRSTERSRSACRARDPR